MLACLGLTHVAAEEGHEHRHHDSHEHGVAELNLAVDGSSVLIELESPAANIVGFEHQPHDAAERDLVTKAIQRLQEAESLFVFTSNANCSVQFAEVETELEQQHEHNDHDHHENEKNSDDHSEFSSNYIFSCEAIDKLKQVEVKLFEEFSGLESIKAQLITPQNQTLIELSAEQNTIDI